MTISVKSNTAKRISINASTETASGVVVKKPAVINTLESISNVSAVGIRDNDTLVYNATTRKWEAQQLATVTVPIIDGGTY